MERRILREQAVREAKVTLILDAARGVFSEKGFYQARLEDIASAAGFSKAALYTYYKDKEEIFVSLAIRDLENLYHQLETRVVLTEGFLDNLEVMLKTIFSFFGENFALFNSVSNFQGMCRARNESLTDRHRQLFDELPEKFKKIMDQQVSLLKMARQRGEVTAEIDDMQLASYMGALIRGVLFQWQISGIMGDVDQEIANLTRFIAHGLGCTQHQ